MALSACGQVICIHLCTTIVCNRSADKGNNAMSQCPSSDRASSSTSQEIPLILWNRKFVTVFTRARETCPNPERDQSSPLYLHFYFIFFFWGSKWLLGAFAKLRKTFVMSVCLSAPSAWNSSASTGGIFLKFYILVFFENMSRKFKFH